jgi:hypothetical protein
VAAIDQHGELDTGGPTEIGDSIKGSAHGTASVEHIIDQDDHLVGDVVLNQRSAHQWCRSTRAQIITIERNIELTNRYLHRLKIGDCGGDPFSEWHATPTDANQDNLLDPAITLVDLMSDAHQRPPDIVCGQHLLSLVHGSPSEVWFPFRLRRLHTLTLPGLG